MQTGFVLHGSDETDGVGLIGFNHCSGEQLQQIMDQETQLKHCYLGAGDCIYL